jgi:hypothetical protein
LQGKTKTRAKKLVEEFICRFGAPYAIHSDQGRDFESNLLKENGALFDSKKQRTTAYHPPIFVSRRKRIGFDNFPLGGTPQTLYR